jgi:CRP/FNR family cyclic AMP-dependent transcriptional regulator
MSFQATEADHRLHAPAGVQVLDVDPDLGTLLSEQRLADARRRLVAREYVVPAGAWNDARLGRAGPAHLGLLVLEGVLARELLMSSNVSTELLGQGDLVRPWQEHGPSRLLRCEVRWTVLEPARFAVLGATFALELARYPEVQAMLIDRVTERSHRLALTQAISQLNGVGQRVLTLLWHLAERWGRITSDGVMVPLVLPHRVIAQVVGARRPTVSTALANLVQEGTVVRLPNGTWLLTGEPVGLPTEETNRVAALRGPRFHRSDEYGRAAPLRGPRRRGVGTSAADR